MTRTLRRLTWALAAVGLIAASVFVFRFPWNTTLEALEGVDVGLLLTALLINLLSPVAKGWAWQLLLKAVAPCRWWVAQEANLIGTAVNSLAAGVAGEAARISLVMQRDGVPARPALLSVAWSRAVEGLGLALFVVIAPFVLDLPGPLRGLQIGAGVALVSLLAVSQFRGWEKVIARLPKGLAGAAADLAAMSSGGRLLGPTALTLLSWAAEWATYHLALRAVHLPVSYAASFTALIAVNLGGLVRLTPANVGVMQAAIVGALLPFGIDADQAVAGGLALQVIEVIPILALAVAVVGWAGLERRLRAAEDFREPA
ncbi:MAG TPA: lysylphosphatidylglycerol synthase transmembrane domain-containing protein [Gemmatimonadales bacterium]|nr:lysylphosphatidylglycerol synthase transmembrane domain-containing protein [Gemmatimonadales bacterium]